MVPIWRGTYCEHRRNWSLALEAECCWVGLVGVSPRGQEKVGGVGGVSGVSGDGDATVRKEEVLVRTVLLLLLGCLVVFGGKKLHLTGAGALAVIVMGVTYKHFVEQQEATSNQEALQEQNSEHNEHNEEQKSDSTLSNKLSAPPKMVSVVVGIKEHFKTLWVCLAEPLLFVLIGKFFNF